MKSLPLLQPYHTSHYFLLPPTFSYISTTTSPLPPPPPTITPQHTPTPIITPQHTLPLRLTHLLLPLPPNTLPLRLTHLLQPTPHSATTSLSPPPLYLHTTLTYLHPTHRAQIHPCITNFTPHLIYQLIYDYFPRYSLPNTSQILNLPKKSKNSLIPLYISHKSSTFAAKRKHLIP